MENRLQIIYELHFISFQEAKCTCTLSEFN